MAKITFLEPYSKSFTSKYRIINLTLVRALSEPNSIATTHTENRPYR